MTGALSKVRDEASGPSRHGLTVREPPTVRCKKQQTREEQLGIKCRSWDIWDTFSAYFGCVVNVLVHQLNFLCFFTAQNESPRTRPRRTSIKPSAPQPATMNSPRRSPTNFRSRREQIEAKLAEEREDPIQRAELLHRVSEYRKRDQVCMYLSQPGSPRMAGFD